MRNVPHTPEEVLETVNSLPPWDPNLDDDPKWLRNVMDYGFINPIQSPTDVAALRNLNVGNVVAIIINPRICNYSGQKHVRLDALAHYRDQEELFDPDGWFGNNYPLIARWKGGYVVLDGLHRVLAARMTGKSLPVLSVMEKV